MSALNATDGKTKRRATPNYEDGLQYSYHSCPSYFVPIIWNTALQWELILELQTRLFHVDRTAPDGL